VAAGAIDPADGLYLAVIRGRLMQRAADREPGAMLALLGDADRARAIAADCGVVIANDNGPTQVVAAGAEAAIDRAEAEAKTRGLRSIRVPVRGAFHTEAVAAAVAPYRRALAEIDVRTPATAVFSCATAEPFPPTGDAIRDALASAIVRPVRWREVLERLHDHGVRRFVEAGPGKTLSAMVRRAFDGVETERLAEAEAAHA
jgi:acyl transferase domain-containing protein